MYQQSNTGNAIPQRDPVRLFVPLFKESPLLFFFGKNTSFMPIELSSSEFLPALKVCISALSAFPSITQCITSFSFTLSLQLTSPSSILLRKVFEQAGFKILRMDNFGPWVSMWGTPLRIGEYQQLHTFHRVSHYPTTFELGRKVVTYLIFFI